MRKLEGPDALLAILIQNQDQWLPSVQLRGNDDKHASPMTLIGVIVK